MDYTFQFTEVFKELPYLLGGAAISLQIAFITFWLGALIGIFGALAKVYGTDISKNIASSYVTLYVVPDFLNVISAKSVGQRPVLFSVAALITFVQL